MTLPPLREARELGLMTYSNGKLCRRGHPPERYVRSGDCVKCKRIRDGSPFYVRLAQASDWPAEQSKLLAHLVTVERLPYPEIARRLGVTKSAAIGRAYRMGISHPNAPNPPTPAPKSTMQRLSELDIFPRYGKCVFPLGHPKEDGFHFCGESVPEIGKPYCEFHDKRTHRVENDPSERGGVVFGRLAAE